MFKDLFLWVLAAISPVLVILKNDKQMVHLLEGWLFQRGRDTTPAKAAFSRHKKLASALLIVGGVWLAVVGIVKLGIGVEGFAVAFGGAVCVLLGILGRLRSFSAAKKELG